MAKRNTSEPLSEAKRRVEQAGVESTSRLDLSQLGLTELPESLWQLELLQELYLGNNQLSSVPEALGQLKEYDLRLMSSVTDVSGIPTAGKSLIIVAVVDHVLHFRIFNGDAKVVVDTDEKRLTELALQIEILRTLLESLWPPHEVTKSEKDQVITAVTSIVRHTQLKQLRELHLNHNQLSSVPESLWQLKQLQKLILLGNQLSSVPEWLGQLNELRWLDVGHNQLSSVPESLGQLEQLQKLILLGNQLSSVPESLGQLKKLLELDLGRNQLSSLPESLGQLTALELLNLSSNLLTSLPRSLSKLSQLKRLFLHGNEGLGIPPEVLGPSEEDVRDRGSTPADPSGILRYYFQVRAGKRPLNEVKFILMGRGGVGKTSLVNRLVRNEFIPNSAKTEGIQITPWPVTVEGETVRLHVWDFGGQEIMHATHQFFLTERSLYLVVLSGREGFQDEDAEYWLKLAASFGAGSPVIVVLNKMHEHPFDVNRRALQHKYTNIHEFVATDCKSGHGIDDLKNALCATLSKWKAWRVDFPAAWFNIKQRLAGMTESYLSFEKFQEVCRDLGEGDAGAHAALAGYLHDLGIALNYKDDPRLRETNVLNPHWVTGGIYRILNASILASRKGELHYDDLSNILPTDSYPRGMQMFLLDLMRKFELCFPFPDDPDHYLVPELLDKQQPEEADPFSPATCLGFEYHYPILPEGLLPRFIVRSHVMSEGLARWRSGVILQFEGCWALVKADAPDKRVQVLVDGPVGNRRRLLAVIRSDFDRIHASIPELKPKEMVPVPGRPEHLIEYRKLAILERQSENLCVEVIGDNVVKIPVSQLLNGVDLSRPLRAAGRVLAYYSPLKLFYSYAHKDERLRNELETHLKILERRGLISPWHDRLIRPGDDRVKEIDVNLEIADIILLLVSADFIASDYCYSTEMNVALEHQKAGKARAIPVLLRDVSWKGAPFARLQMLPKNLTPVTQWRDRDAAWQNVSEGIEEAVKSIRERR